MTNVSVTTGAHATPPAVTSESRNHMIEGSLHNRQSASYVHKMFNAASLDETNSGHVLFNKVSDKQLLDFTPKARELARQAPSGLFVVHVPVKPNGNLQVRASLGHQL